mmetsp:Transcript_24799/g.74560  ORF Transcript_24799/g.74560 Transcript_24799/m.74560 type:complete len:207 (-) Transcript_24799:274-894(-)|eukprot:CAMPEP_0182922046 /NCGR_PEP_ID=MMETSP0105_2-20130417/4543_1 /TAXON_ID=81532 ORGANISM="Acanthoeca-like sp., Strain 10tr" /NCGR_SAMPLE_ID=MMETSP0105_2 /ASSEMBLY_ACC=CAM_ASM_000205 /LENGTH=206 /DNA_ID=CAMNT_0025059635 /DNA_START=285 /DNA_END=905 /DNA_ORIENTATION=+
MERHGAGKTVMVVSREVAAGLETALSLAFGPPPQDGGEMEHQPPITMVCKKIDYNNSSGETRGVRHVSPGKYASDHDLLLSLRGKANRASVLILDNTLQSAIRLLRQDWGMVIFVTAYPVLSPGLQFSTVVTTPSCNDFTLSSLYKSLKSAAGNTERALAHNPTVLSEMTKELKQGDVLSFRAEATPECAVDRWTVSTEPLATCCR